MLVEADGGGVPFEDVPLEAGAAFGLRDGDDVGEESFADSLPSLGWADVEVFDVDAVMAAPGGVVVEVEGEADWLVFDVGYEAVEAGSGAEAVAEEVGLGGEDGFGFALVGGEVADELQDLGDVGGSGWADGQHVLFRLMQGWGNGRCEIQGSLHCGFAFGRDDAVQNEAKCAGPFDFAQGRDDGRLGACQERTSNGKNEKQILRFAPG